MKDAFHGSARPVHGLVTARPWIHRLPSSTPIAAAAGHRRAAEPPAPRRSGFGVPAPIALTASQRIVLEVDAAWAAIPCWSGRARALGALAVPTAYAQRYDTHVRPAMPQQSGQPENALSPWPRRAPRSPITAPDATAGRPTPGSRRSPGCRCAPSSAPPQRCGCWAWRPR